MMTLGEIPLCTGFGGPSVSISLMTASEAGVRESAFLEAYPAFVTYFVLVPVLGLKGCFKS